MFGKRSKTQHLIEISKLSSLIADDVEIVGDIRFASGLRIDGTLRGSAVGQPGEGKTHSLLVVSDKGRVEGTIRCYDAVINGTVEGELDVEHFLELQPNARVSGTIRYSSLQMEVGAMVDGRLEQRDSNAPRATVVDLGSEKEKARNAG